MDDKQMLEQMDADERIYAPEELPVEEQARVRADEGRTYGDPNEPPAAAPIANLGTPSGEMAPPNLGQTDQGGAPGDPAPQAADPLNPDR